MEESCPNRDLEALNGPLSDCGVPTGQLEESKSDLDSFTDHLASVPGYMQPLRRTMSNSFEIPAPGTHL